MVAYGSGSIPVRALVARMVWAPVQQNQRILSRGTNVFTAQQVVEHFDGQIDQPQAEIAARLMNGQIEIDPFDVPDEFPQTADWCNRCYHPPNAGELILSALNETVGGFGVEYIDDDGECIAEYVNVGESYSPTIVRDTETGEFILSSWGDWYEGWIAEQNANDGTIDCGYCSHRTPLGDAADWHDVVCESCGHRVDGSE